MTRRVLLPNGKFVDFPDETTDEEINRILREQDQRTLVADASIPRRVADFGVKAVGAAADIAGGAIDVAQPDAAAPFSQVTRPLELMAQRAVKAAPAVQALPGIGPVVTGLATAGRGREMAMALDSAAMGLVGDQETRASIENQRIAERIAENKRREAEGRQSLDQETAAQPATRASQAVFAASDTASDKLVSDRTKAGDIEMGRAYEKGLLDWLSAAADSPGDAVLQLGPSVAAFIAAGGVTGAMARGAGASRATSLTAVTQSQGAMASDLSARAQQERVSGMTPDEFAQTPTGKALIESGMSPAEAKQQTALLAYDTTLAASLPLNAVAMSLTTRLGGNPVEEVLAGSKNLTGSALTKSGLTGRLQRGAQAGVREGLGEAAQGATEQLASNIGGIGAGIQGRETLFDDVLKAGAIEGIAGAPTGAAVGLMQRPMTEQQAKDLRAVEAAMVARERLSTKTEKDNPLTQGMRDAQAVVEAARAGKFAQPIPSAAPVNPAAEEASDTAPAPQVMEQAAPKAPSATEVQQSVTEAAPNQVPRGTVEPIISETSDIDALLDMTERQRGASLAPTISTTSDPAALAAYTARKSGAGSAQAATPAVPQSVSQPEPAAAGVPASLPVPPAAPPVQSQSRAPGAAPSMVTPRDETRGGIDGLIEPVADYGRPKTGSGRAASALLKRLGLTAEEAVIAESPDQVPELASILDQMDRQTEGLYYNGKVYIFEGAIENTSRGGRPAMERAVWVATHEAVKHRGLDLLLTPAQKTTLLEQADTNELIQSIANDIQAEAESEAARGAQGARRAPRSIYVEEALAELSGAMLTDNYEALFSRYQGAARAALKPAQGIVRRVAKAAWNTLRGKANVTFTDRDVLRLISDSYRATTTMRSRPVVAPVDAAPSPQDSVAQPAVGLQQEPESPATAPPVPQQMVPNPDDGAQAAPERPQAAQPKPQRMRPRARASAPMSPTDEGRQRPAESASAPLQSRAPTFYSATLRAIEDGRGAPKRADASAWKGWLDGAVRRGEMKQSERDWLGLDAWLDAQDSPIAREALADFVRANEVKVEEVVLGEQPVSPDLVAYLDASGKAAPTTVTGWMNLSKSIESSAAREQRSGDAEMANYLFSLSESASLQAEALDGVGGGNTVRYGKYRIPGGENYREMLLTLPEKPTTGNEGPAGWADVGNSRSRTGDQNFQSSHWDQPNVLAHVRFDERTDADGNRVLFINEIQSDWHQKGRKKGYRGSVSDADAKAWAGLTDAEWEQATDAQREEARRGAGDHGVPDAPLKQTDEWAMLAFKRMARWGVDNGFDRIAWVTGEQAADLFDLSRQISRVIYEDNSSGGAGLQSLDGPPDSGTLSAYDLNGRRVIYEYLSDPKKVTDYIGKDVAERLFNQRGRRATSAGMGVRVRELSGLDLKVGGEGMRGFYDKILPAAVNKWGKKFGAKVARTWVSTTTAEQADKDAALLEALGQAVDDIRGQDFGASVHAMDITPAMRDAVAQGQPLFSRAPPVDSAEFRAWFGDSKVVDENGEPLVVYHGTRNGGFAVFETPSYFSESPGESAIYSTDESSMMSRWKGARTSDGFDLQNLKEGISFADTDWWKPGRWYLVEDGVFRKTESGAIEMSAEGAASYDILANKFVMKPALETRPSLTYPVYLSIKNPAAIPWYIGNKLAGDDNQRGRANKELIEELKAKGYDGVITESDWGMARNFIPFYPDQIKAAIGNVGAFGQRPVTDAEAAPLGMTVAEANAAQARGDIRFSRAARPNGLSRPREITPEFVERLRARKSFLAELLRDQGRTLKQMQDDVQRVQALFADLKDAPDFEAEITGAEADLKRARRNALEGSRQDLAAYDAIRDLLAVLREGRRRVVSDGNRALKLAQRIAEGSQIMSMADRQSIMETLEPMLESAERTYVAHRKIMQWRRGREYARIKAHRRQTDALNFLAAEGFTQGSLTWQADSLLEKKELLRRRIRRTMQDKFIDLRDIQDTIEEQIGAELDDAQNVYLAENLMHGRVADAMKAFRESFVEPLKAAIKASGFTIEQVEQYLWAKHATERNARVREINRTNDAGSGMTDDKAAEILTGYSAEQLERLESLGARVKSIRAFTLKTLLFAGQIDKASYDRVLGMYDNYVPLRHRNEGEERVGGTGQGLSSGASSIQRALGRTKPPENILAELVGDAERAIVQSGKAEVGRALLRLVLSYPNPDIWDIEPVVLEAKFSEATGEVYLGIGTPDDAETVIVKHNGKPYRVRVKHPQLAAVMRNTGFWAAATPIAVDTFGRITRWLSAVLTRYNPGFVPINAMRDLLQGMTGVWAELGAESAAAVAKGYGESFGAAFRQARENRGDASKPDDQKTIDDWAREAYEAGMPTGMAALDDMDALSRDIEMTMLSIKESMKRYPAATIGKALVESAPLRFVENLNDAVENAIRLSTYTHLRRDKGWSQQKAATYAKEMTVNFNRRGTGGSVINAFYLFYNAATQGSRRTIKLILEQPKVQGFVASLVAGQFALAAMFGMQTFDEDDDETLWEKIPDYVKQRSFIPYAWFDKDGTPRWIAIPMPYGFNLFPAFGSRMANYLSPNYREKMTSPTKDILGGTLASVIDAFSPVQVGDDNALAPTILRIWIEAKANRDDLGNQIGPSDDYRDRNLPASTNYRPGTDESFVAMAKALNRIGGGNDYSKPAFSAFDWSPNEIEYFFKKLTGGAGSVIIDFYKQATREIPSGEARLYETPVVRSLVGGVRPESQEMRRFYDESSRVTIARQKLRDAFKRGGVEEFEAEKERIGAAADGVELRVMKRDSTKKDEIGNPVRRAGELAVDVVSGAPELATASGSVAALHAEAQAFAREIGTRMRSVYNDQSIGPVERERRLRELQRERQDAVAKFNRAIARARLAED